MTYREIIDIFGDDSNPDGAILKLSVSYPYFSGKDLIDIFKTVCNNYHIFKIDNIINMSGLKIESYADNILRTIYQIMFVTDYWDTEILLQPEFVSEFTLFYNDFKFKKVVLPKRQRGYVLIMTYDLLDKLDEFRYRLTEKVKSCSGI